MEERKKKENLVFLPGNKLCERRTMTSTADDACPAQTAKLLQSRPVEPARVKYGRW